MPNRRYEQGTRFELKVIEDLQACGYVTVRAAGSKGAGKVDVIACRPDYHQPHHLWIQCKRTGLIPPGEWNQLWMCAGWACAVPVLAQNGPRGRGVTYHRLDALKVPGSRVRPYTAVDLRATVAI